MLHSIIYAGKMLLLLAAGVVLAFYPVFDIIFSDKHAQSDYIAGLIIVGASFLIASGITALLMCSWRFPFWLTLPSTLVLIGYSRTETQQIPYHLAVFAVLVAGTAAGAVTGTSVRGSHTGKRN